MKAVGRKFGRWLDTVYMQRDLVDVEPLADAKKTARTRQGDIC